MGFEPKTSHPIKFKLAGIDTRLSITSAQACMLELRALIAEARLVEAGEYLSYRIQQHEDQIATLNLTINRHAGELAKAKKRSRRTR